MSTSFRLQDLNPAPVYVVLHKKRYRLRTFTLADEVYTLSKYETIKDFIDALNNPTGENYLANFEFIFSQFENQDDFKTATDLADSYFTVKDDSLKLTISKSALISAIQDINKACSQLIENAAPFIKNAKRTLENYKLQQAANGKKDTDVNYAEYYDRLARRYGYTITQFYALTMRQLHALLASVNDGDYKELEIQAALAGRELKEPMKYLDISPEDDDECDERATEAYERLKADYERRQKNGQ